MCAKEKCDRGFHVAVVLFSLVAWKQQRLILCWTTLCFSPVVRIDKYDTFLVSEYEFVFLCGGGGAVFGRTFISYCCYVEPLPGLKSDTLTLVHYFQENKQDAKSLNSLSFV